MKTRFKTAVIAVGVTVLAVLFSTAQAQTVDAPCLTYIQNVVVLDGGTIAQVPASPILQRDWIRICVSRIGTSATAVTKCLMDGGTPTMSPDTPGEEFAPGDCSRFYTKTPIYCVSDGAGTRVITAECSHRAGVTR